MSSRGRRFVYAVLLPATLTFLFFPFSVDGPIHALDEGIWLSLAQAFHHGQRLYSDVWFQYGPLLTVPTRLAVAFDQVTLADLRMAQLLPNLVWQLIIYAALCRWVKDGFLRVSAALALWLCPWAQFTTFVPMAFRYGPAFLAILVWPEPSASVRREKNLSLASGASCALAIFISQEIGIAITVATGAYLAAGENSHKRLRFFFISWAGVVAVMLGGVALFCGVGAYIQCAFIDIGRFQKMVLIPPPLLESSFWQSFWQHKGDALFFNFFAIVAASAAPVISALLALVFYGRRRKAMSRPLIVGLAFFALAASGSAWGRADTPHIYFALPAAILFWAAWADLIRIRVKRPRLTGGLSLLIAVMLTAPPYVMRVQIMREQAGQLTASSSLPLGGAKIPLSQAEMYEELTGDIQTHTKKEEPLLSYPANGAVFLLADRPIGSRFPVLIEGALPYHQREIIAEMKERPVRWVVMIPTLDNLNGKPPRVWLSDVRAEIGTHYEPRVDNQRSALLERKALYK